MHYDPRKPPATAMVHNGSTHPAHGDLRKTLVLLSLGTLKGPVYFIVNGLNRWPATYDELQNSERFFYDEHSCPTNYIHVERIIHDGDGDPHGVFTFVEAVWLTRETEAILDAHADCGEKFEHLCEIWPQLATPPSLSPADESHRSESR